MTSVKGTNSRDGIEENSNRTEPCSDEDPETNTRTNKNLVVWVLQIE